MEQNQKLFYAKKRLDQLEKEELNGLNKINLFENSIFLEFTNGMNFELSDKEINYQAVLFLESEIESIINA